MQPGLDARELRVRVDVDLAHARQVERHAAVRQGEPGDVVAAALDRELDFVVSREIDGLHHVFDSASLDNHGRLLLDHAIPKLGSLGEPFVTGMQERAFKACGEFVERHGVLKVHKATIRPGSKPPWASLIRQAEVDAEVTHSG